MSLQEWYNIKLITIGIDVLGFIGAMVKCHKLDIFNKRFIFFLIIAVMFLMSLVGDMDIMTGKYTSFFFVEPIKSLTIKGTLTLAVWYVILAKEV